MRPPASSFVLLAHYSGTGGHEPLRALTVKLRENCNKRQPTERFYGEGWVSPRLPSAGAWRDNVMGGLGMSTTGAGCRCLARLYHFSSNCWPTSSCGVFSTVYLRRSFTSYLQSLASTRLSLPSALSLQQILFVALLVNFLILSLHLSIPRGKSFIPMFSRGTFPAFILSSALVAFAADIIPTVPDPGHIYNEGSTCQVGWTPDSTGQWKSMNIQLMTGSNFQMVPLTSSSSCIFFGASDD
jgi:hypothetical protein